MNFWLDLFSGTTWDEFRKAGSSISGFRPRMKGVASKIMPGDVLLCYMTGVMRWVGALEVVHATDDQTPIWKELDFPVRFLVQPLIMLDAEEGVPMDQLQGHVEFFSGVKDRGKFKGFVRRSPNLFRRQNDGLFVMELLEKARKSPVARPVDAKKFARRPFFKAEQKKGKSTITTVVAIPGPEETQDNATADGTSVADAQSASTRHTEIQYELLRLGADMGFDVWVARNDRGKAYRGSALGSIARVVTELPTQFNEATNRTIELIDVLWLKGNSILAAFEVECTTSVYSGLLRMSDLLALQPNLEIRLYLVAPDERRAKVEQEILRPTFSFREKPLSTVCGFLSFSRLTEKVDGIRRLGLASSLKPDFLEQTAEFFGRDEENPS